MPRLKAVTTAEADTKVRAMFGKVEKKLGMIPNVMRTMGNSPVVLESYLAFTNALATGSIPTRLREQIALAVGEANNCAYCLAAHTTLGRMAGLSDAEIAASRQGEPADSKVAAALTFARKLVHERGLVNDGDVQHLRTVGYKDGEITEIVAQVVVNIFTNYLNHVAQTDIDFPKAQALDDSTACACAA